MNRSIFSIVLAIVLAATAMILSGCATTEISTPEMTIKTSTLWKNIESASAQTENLVLELGSSNSNEDAKALVLACVMFPDMPACKSD